MSDNGKTNGPEVDVQVSIGGIKVRGYDGPEFKNGKDSILLSGNDEPLTFKGCGNCWITGSDGKPRATCPKFEKAGRNFDRICSFGSYEPSGRVFCEYHYSKPAPAPVNLNETIDAPADPTDAEVRLTVPLWATAVIDMVRDEENKATGAEWSRADVARRFLLGDLRTYRDGAFTRELLNGKAGE